MDIAAKKKHAFSQRYDRDVWLRHAKVKTPKQSQFRRRITPYYEIYWFICGKGDLVVDNSVYPLHPGDVTVFKPLEVHQLQIDPSVSFEKISIQFGPQTFSEFDTSGALLRAFAVRPAGRFNVLHPEDFPDDHWKNCLLRLVKKTDTPEDDCLQVYGNLFALCSEVSLALQKKMQEKAEAGMPLPDQVLDYVNKNLISIPSVTELAQQLNFSPSGLRALFKRTVGVAPQQYLTEKRLELARSMLIAGTPAYRACALSGFRDYTAFFRAYKQRFGVSPKPRNDVSPTSDDAKYAEDYESFPED